ncbi:hypothetical protein MTE2_4809 [Klebsiella pneumoniae VA360]|nr:hypothetical protein MTE2_4809 [Klebsiella pneumoniae VA360]
MHKQVNLLPETTRLRPGMSQNVRFCLRREHAQSTITARCYAGHIMYSLRRRCVMTWMHKSCSMVLKARTWEITSTKQ